MYQGYPSDVQIAFSFKLTQIDELLTLSQVSEAIRALLLTDCKIYYY